MMLRGRKLWSGAVVRIMAAVMLVSCFAGVAPAAYAADPVAENVGVTLGATPVEQGITARPGDDPTGLVTGEQDGKTYWETNKTEGSRILYFYLNVDDSFLFDNGDHDVQVTVEYLDSGNGSIVLQYDAESAAFKDAPLFTYGNTGTWKTHTFDLSDAKFANRTNGGDFRIGIEGAGASWATNANLKLASVVVGKTLKPQQGEQASVTLGAVPAENGISPRAGDDPAGLITGETLGKTYWQTQRSVGTAYLYMNVDDAFLYDNTDQDVFVTVEYLDSGNGAIVLQYDAAPAAFKDAPLFTYKNAGAWKTYTYRLTDAKFANRANGADFRIGVEGAGAPSNGPDLRLASVTVKKQPRFGGVVGSAVVETVYPTDDVVIANADVTDYGAVGDGIADDTQAFQYALDAVGLFGGGVVFAPAGQYKLLGSLTVPTGVTLRGDWADPEDGGGVRGTVLQVYANRGNEEEASFIQMQPSSGVTNLSVWYPEQSLANPSPYPWTFEQLSGDSATIRNVTLVNAYKGIKIGPVWNELHYVDNVLGTVLHTGIFLDYTTDIGRLEGVKLSPRYWAESGLAGAPSVADLRAYTVGHAEGVVMGRSDWEYMSDIHLSGFKTGMRITTRTGSTETANAQLYRIRIDDSNVALKIEGVNSFGLLVSDSEFKAEAGDSPVAILATSGFSTIAQFNSVKIGGATRSAVVNEGSGVLSFENSTIEQWDAAGGGYAIDARKGAIILGQTTFALPDQHVRLGSGVSSLRSLNSGMGGVLAFVDESGGAEVSVDFEAATELERMPLGLPTDVPVRPKPATNALFDVTAAPYGADRTGGAEASDAVRQALADAAAAGGGTVYLPAGIYRISQPLTVPTGVELRGSWDVPHHTIGGGTVLFTDYGRGDPDGAPLIALQARAGTRGFSVYYDQQSWANVVPFSWTVQGQGHDVYAIDTTLINPYRAIDFGTYDTSGHYIDYAAGSPLMDGIFIGGGAEGGFVRNLQFNPHYYGRNPYPNHPTTDPDFQLVWEYQKNNLDALRVGDVSGETIFNTFVYGSKYGIHFTKQAGQGPEAFVVGHGTDGSKKGALIDGAGPGGLTLVNTELVAMSSTDKTYVELGQSFDGKATFFNSSMWGDTNHSVDLYAGKLRMQQSNIVSVGQIGVNAIGGDMTLFDSYFQQAGTTHVYAGPTIEKLVLSNNLFAGGIRLVNEAPSKVSGTNVYPISLTVDRPAYNGKKPERSLATLKLKNLAVSPKMSGRMEIVSPGDLSAVATPIRFQGVALGQTLDIPLPYANVDSLKVKITLDGGRSYFSSVVLAQAFAASEKPKKHEAPPIRLVDADHYHSFAGAWEGTNDLSASASAEWNRDKLLFDIVVKDDVHAQSWANGDIWQGDSIQLGIDMSRADGSASANVNELGFALGGDGTVTSWRWRAPTGVAAGALPGAQTVVTRDEAKKETRYVISLPISSLHGAGYKFDADQPLGFALLVNENDGSGRAGFMEYNQGIGTSKDSTTFGDLILLEDDFAKQQEKLAEDAVKDAEKLKTQTLIDIARNFVAVVPDAKVREELNKKLDKIKVKP